MKKKEHHEIRDHINPAKRRVWRMFFEADAYPHVVSFLALTPLSKVSDYHIRDLDAVAEWKLDLPPNIDSLVHLYEAVPEEAQWIPILEELFKCDSSSSS